MPCRHCVAGCHACPQCGSSASCPTRPSCSSPSAWATTSSPSPTSATFPLAARSLPQITRDVLPAGLSAGEIDAAVRERTERGEAIYELDAQRLRELEPDLIVTQELCPVCAVSIDDVRAVAETHRQPPARRRPGPAHARRVLRRRPHDRPAHRLAQGRPGPHRPPARARRRACAWRCAGPSGCRWPRIEWFDPVFIAGHWTPQIVDIAGGIDVLGFAGEHSEQSTWETVAAAAPRVVVAMPCGYDAERSHAEASAMPARCAPWAPSGSSRSTPRPTSRGPGRAWSTAWSCMAHILHPDLVPEPVGRGSRGRGLSGAGAQPAAARARRRRR